MFYYTVFLGLRYKFFHEKTFFVKTRNIWISSEALFSDINLWYCSHARTLCEFFHKFWIIANIYFLIWNLKWIEKVLSTDAVRTVGLCVDFYHEGSESEMIVWKKLSLSNFRIWEICKKSNFTYNRMDAIFCDVCKRITMLWHSNSIGNIRENWVQPHCFLSRIGMISRGHIHRESQSHVELSRKIQRKSMNILSSLVLWRLFLMVQRFSDSETSDIRRACRSWKGNAFCFVNSLASMHFLSSSGLRTWKNLSRLWNISLMVFDESISKIYRHLDASR